MNKKVHKRFLAFAITTGLITLGFFIGPQVSFEMFAKALGFIYTFYLGGQSATDWQVAANGKPPGK